MKPKEIVESAALMEKSKIFPQVLGFLHISHNLYYYYF